MSSKTTTSTKASASKKTAKTVTPTVEASVPVPETVVESTSNTPMPRETSSPISSVTPDTKPQDSVAPLTVDENTKTKPIKVAESKVRRWADNLKKAQESSNNKLVASVLNGLETVLSRKQTAGTKTTTRNLSEYNVFVQQNIKQVAAQNANLSNKEVMVKIAEMWQTHKASLAKKA